MMSHTSRACLKQHYLEWTWNLKKIYLMIYFSSVPSTDIVVLFPPVSTIVAGETLRLQCLAEKLNTGYTGTLVVSWRGPDMTVLEEDLLEDVTVTNSVPFNGSLHSVLTMDSLSTSEAGSYTCLVTMATPLLPHAINHTMEQNVAVRSMSNYHIIVHNTSTIIHN